MLAHTQIESYGYSGCQCGHVISSMDDLSVLPPLPVANHEHWKLHWAYLYLVVSPSTSAKARARS
eukprot:2854735-Prorocentrum_lima.AAC.1